MSGQPGSSCLWKILCKTICNSTPVLNNIVFAYTVYSLIILVIHKIVISNLMDSQKTYPKFDLYVNKPSQYTVIFTAVTT